YNASKTGAVGLTRTLGEAWAREGIRVNGIAPGFVATKMTKVTTDNPERLENAISRIPVGRMGTPADMAGVALFLASPLAAYVVGQTIPVDGGLILALGWQRITENQRRQDMAWDFETDADFQRELDWIDEFVRNEVEPLDFVLGSQWDIHDPRFTALVRPLQQIVKERRLWACHLGPELGG